MAQARRNKQTKSFEVRIGVAQIGKKFIYAVVTVMALMVFGACEKTQEMTDPKGALEQKAAAYWNKRLVDQDYKATYEMELQKDSVPYETYLKIVYNAGKIKYLKITTQSVEINDDTGKVEMRVRCMIPPISKAMNLTLGDEWVIEENQWKHVIPESDIQKHMPKK